MLETSRRESPVVPPTYGYTRDGKVPYKPTVKEIWMELGDSLNFFHHPSRALPLLSICFHFMGLVCLLSFFIWCFSWKAFLYFFFSVLFMLIIYNTVWYHRYCSHGSFEFAHPKISLLFLMTNPFIFREESYA